MGDVIEKNEEIKKEETDTRDEGAREDVQTPKNEGSETSSDDPILALKYEIADEAIARLKASRGGLSEQALNLTGDGMIKDFLVSGDNILDNVMNSLKGPLIDRALMGLDAKSFTLKEMKEVDGAKKEVDVTYTSVLEYLNTYKEKINASDSEADLKELLAEVKGGVVPEVPATQKPDQQIDAVPIPTDADIAKIQESVEIKGVFAKIKKVKDVDGHVILECTGKTPFINAKILPDILGLAKAFYAETKQALSITSAYRTIAQQAQLDKETPALAAEPGKSGHNLGLCIDIQRNDKVALGDIEKFRILAKTYHFTPIKGEDWHFDHETLPSASDRLVVAQRLDTEFTDAKLAA